MSDIAIEQHFVTFYSPGTFVSETNEKSIPAWDVELAKQMALDIHQRHGATPYAFRFSTRGRTADELDSKTLRSSNLYYLGGKVETREEVEARNDPAEQIMRENMRRNDIAKVIVNTNSWRFTGALNDGDVVLDFTSPARKETAVA